MKNPLIFLFLIVILLTAGVMTAYNAQQEVVSITIVDKTSLVYVEKKAILHTFLIYTKHEVFQNTNTWAFGKFHSSDMYRKLHIGNTYTVLVVGWKIPILNIHRNIVEIRD